jgi:hypothetical protein
MTISMFDAYLERMILHRTERMMDMGQSSIYAQLTTEGRRKMWNGWSNIVFNINTNMLYQDAQSLGRSVITWNGQPISIKGLTKKFANMFGKRSVVR